MLVSHIEEIVVVTSDLSKFAVDSEYLKKFRHSGMIPTVAMNVDFDLVFWPRAFQNAPLIISQLPTAMAD